MAGKDITSGEADPSTNRLQDGGQVRRCRAVAVHKKTQVIRRQDLRVAKRRQTSRT